MSFKPGESGNPNGRPKGPSAHTRAMRERIEAECDPVGFLSSVMKGERLPYTDDAGGEAHHTPTMEQRISAARTLTGKLVPDAKDRPIAFDVGEIAGPSDALAVMGRVIAAMGEGSLTPTEGKSVMEIVALYLKAWEAEDLERRIAALEAKA